MSDTIVNKFKCFWAWQDDKEEVWLGEKSAQGLHLKYPGPFGQYIFEQGIPLKYAYRLDFVTKSRKNDEYLRLFQDAGWEHVGQMGGWQYWRKEIQDGKVPEIFTDRESKVQKYQRLLGYLIIFLPIFIVNIINIGDTLTRYEHWAIKMIYSIFYVIFPVYIYALLMISRRIITLKRRY